MIIVQDAFGRVLVPYGIKLSEYLYEIFNEPGLVFVPFMVALIQAFVKARAQGLDEGSPAVFAIKLFEKSFYSMLFVLVIFVMPWNTGKMETSLVKHQCGFKREITLQSIYSNSQALNYLSQNMPTTVDSLSLGMGLINNMTVGISETISAKTSCVPDLDSFNVKMNETHIDIEDKNLIANLKSFADQCYNPAMNRINQGSKEGRSILKSPYSPTNNIFYGSNLISSYNGTANSPHQSQMTFQIKGSEYAGVVKDKYKPSNYDESFWSLGTTNKLAISCSDAANDYKDILTHIIKNKYEKEITASLASSTHFPKLTDEGGAAFVNEQSVYDGYIQKSFVDSVIGSQTMTNQDYLEQANSGLWGSIVNSFTSAKNALSNPFKMDLWKNITTSAGLALEIKSKAADRVNMYAVMPLIITIVITVVHIATPVLLILSSYSLNLVKDIAYFYFYLVMIPFILSISYSVSNLIFILSESFYSATGIHSNGEWVMVYLMYMIPIFFMLGWTAACTIAGLKLGPLITALFTGAAAASAKAGNKVFDSTVGGKAGSISKAIGSSKRQI